MLSDEIEAFLERNGWTRKIAGNADFDAAVNALAKVCQSENQGLLISGEYGCGKTSLMKLVTRSFSPVYSVYFGTRNQEERLMDRYFEYMGRNPYRMHVLIDDLGAEKQQSEYGIYSDLVPEFISTWEMRSMMERKPEDDVKRLFITTNLNGEEIDERYGGRLLSRLKGLCVPLKLTGDDKRQWNI